MIKYIKQPSIIPVEGNKKIEEFFGIVNSDDYKISIAKMTSPQGWIEEPQSPKFDEYTVVLKGTLKIKTDKEDYIVNEGESILTGKDELVQYSTPFEGGAEYIAICSPAFSVHLVNRIK